MTPDPILTDFLRDDAGAPLGRGMPSGRPLRDDGQSHYAAWLSLVKRDPCAYCPGAAGTVDHIEPRSGAPRAIGGLHDWLNATGACGRCNGAKRDLDLLEFLRRRRGVPPRRPRGRRRSGAAPERTPVA